MSKILRLGFIGAGDIANLQLKLLERRKDVQVVAVADINQEILNKRATQMPKTRCFTDHKQMLAEVALDAVSVCTPNKLHAQPSIDALAAGCHVLCEKPLATTEAECSDMLAAAQAADRSLIVGFQYRFDPRTRYIRAAYDAGDLGNVLYGRVQAMRRRGIPNWGRFGEKAVQGGGPLIDIGVHALEMAHYAMGSPNPVSASADMFTYIGDKPSTDMVSMWPNWNHETYDVEDLAVGRIRFDNGAVIHIESAFAAHIAENSVMNFQLMGDRGGAVWDNPQVFTDEHQHLVDKAPAWLPDTSFEKTFKRKMDAFVEHVLNGAENIAPGADGLVVQAMLNGLYRSAEAGGREVEISV